LIGVTSKNTLTLAERNEPVPEMRNGLSHC
jgi:hypothetical protein